MVYSPTSFTSYGWKGAAPYNAADIPIPNAMVAPGVDRTVLEQRFAYEWYDQSGRYASGRNPPFNSKAAGQILPSLLEDGLPPRILRGFIRRAEYDATDYKSTARLYFMFNPTEITRDYVSYLDQGALDPFNTVFQAGNLVPPPSFMDFTFSLLFDRQTEAMDPQHPGVFVDYEYFDLVVRNVVPVIDPNGTSNTLPDNGVMMVNPRDITVVFSPQITVQGRPSNARVTFQKFTHRMVPTRMQIDLTMRVTYFGPMKDMTTYPADEAVVAESVPWTAIQSPFEMTQADIEAGKDLFLEQMKANMLTEDQLQTILKAAEDAGLLPEGTAARQAASADANMPINEAVVDFALSMCTDGDGPPKYANDNANRHKLWTWADCSSFVWGAYAGHTPPYNTNMGSEMGISFADGTSGKKHIPASATITDLLRKNTIPSKAIFTSTSTKSAERRKVIEPALPLVAKGDILCRREGQTDDAHGHVALIYANDTAGQKLEVVDAAGTNMVGKRSIGYSYIWEHYTDCFRPMLGTPNSPDAQNPPNPGD